MSGFGGASPFPPWMGQYVGAANEFRRYSNLGMQGSQSFAAQARHLQTVMAGEIFRSPQPQPDSFRAKVAKLKPTKTVCAYCGGPDYKERSCPGCGAREKETR